jgi:hypothetical protein
MFFVLRIIISLSLGRTAIQSTYDYQHKADFTERNFTNTG